VTIVSNTDPFEARGQALRLLSVIEAQLRTKDSSDPVYPLSMALIEVLKVLVAWLTNEELGLSTYKAVDGVMSAIEKGIASYTPPPQ
jgi:hypothetical protein